MKIKLGISVSSLLLGIFIAFSSYKIYELNGNVNYSNDLLIYLNNKKEIITSFNNQSFFVRFISLLSHNLYVCLLMLLGGYLTMGICSFLVLTYNGFIITSVLIHVFKYEKIFYIISKLMHAPFEIISLIWFCYLGLFGWDLQYNYIFKDRIIIKNIVSLKKILIPFMFLVIAAFLEAL